ncbi:hypothetical protein HGRIS_009023 [Hohenbuehelia grisea]|uniref:F-box domain-containing protein n=1 Tax=Hohenbuehelia grisea TaxID=104357 RepID=A0ABR3J017_9AGAR
MDAARIPSDVVLEILEFTTDTDLPTLCLLNSAFYSHARDYLYRHISGLNAAEACLSIIRNPSLAPLVRSFELPVHARTLPKDYTFTSVLQRALPMMTNLTCLKLMLYASYSSVLENCHQALDLRILHCALFPDPKLAAFIRSQANLTELMTDHASDVWADFGGSIDTITRLNKLIAPWSVAKTLTPGRPIRDLTITTSFRDCQLSFMEASIATIEHLSVQSLLLGSLRGGIPSEGLRHLTVDCCGVDARVHFSAPTPWLSENIRTLSHLQSCTLVGLKCSGYREDQVDLKTDMLNFLSLLRINPASELRNFSFGVIHTTMISALGQTNVKMQDMQLRWKRNGDSWLEEE